MSSCPLDPTIPIDLGSIITNAWLIGFLFAVFTKSLWVGPLLYAIAQYLIFWPALYRELPEPGRFDYQIYPLLTILLASLNGLTFSGAFLIPRLIDMRLIGDPEESPDDKSYDIRQVKLEGFFIMLGTLIIIASYFFLIDAFGNGCGTLGNDVSLGLGIGLVILGSLMVLITIIYTLYIRKIRQSEILDLDKAERLELRRLSIAVSFNKAQNIKYILLLGLFMLTYLFYDIFGPGNLRGLWALIYLTGITIIAYFYIFYLPFGYHGYWVKNVTTLKVKEGGVIIMRGDRLEPSWFIIWFLIFLWINSVVAYTVGYTVSVFATSEAWVTSITLMSVSLFFIILWSILAYFNFLPKPLYLHNALILGQGAMNSRTLHRQRLRRFFGM